MKSRWRAQIQFLDITPGQTPIRRRGDLVAVVLPVAVLLAFALWQGMLDRQSTWAHLGVSAAIVAAFAGAVIAGRGRQRLTAGQWVDRTRRGWRGSTPAYRTGVVIWVLLLVSVVGWDVNSFVHQAHDLPTLSGEIGRITRYHAGRTIFFAAWLAVGAYLAFGWRAGRSR